MFLSKLRTKLFYSYQKRYYEQEFIFLRKNHKAFLDIAINGEPKGRLTFELFFNYTPKTAMNFFNLCKGYTNNYGKYISLKNTKFHRAVPGLLVQGGKITEDNKESYYGGNFADENFVVSHKEPGILSMANDGVNTNGTQFFITTSQCDWFDGKHVAFGKVIEGIDVLNNIEGEGKFNGELKSEVEITDCGVIEVKEEDHDHHGHHHDHHEHHEEHNHNHHENHEHDSKKNKLHH